MTCQSCGRMTQDQEANYCFYCGDSFREPVDIVINPKPQAEEAQEQSLSSTTLSNEKPIAFSSWLRTYAIMFIPYVGLIVFIALCVYWSVADNVVETKKSWARATLIFLGINLIMGYILLSTIMPELLGGSTLGDLLWLGKDNFKV